MRLLSVSISTLVLEFIWSDNDLVNMINSIKK